MAGQDTRDVITGYDPADAKILTSALSLIEDPSSDVGKSILSTANVTPDASAEEDARVEFNQDQAGEIALWARLYADSYNGDAIYIGFDGHMERVFPDSYGEYVWVMISVADLDSGAHRISLGAAEPGVRVDRLATSRRTDLGRNDLESWAKGRGVPNGPDPEEPIAPVPDEPTSNPPSEYDLRGDPGFSVGQLPAAAQTWYWRLWAAIEESRPRAERQAASDNLYIYGRTIHTHIQSILTAFRATGDLKLLDEIDRLTTIMRAELADEWRGTQDGTDGTKDGYRNWVWREGSRTYDGKDTHKLDEMKTHALIASVALALDLNRDLPSPSGRDYAAHADFWIDYLVSDFEPKWRAREGVETGFPIMIRPDNHTYYSWMKWHYYMWRLSGNADYLTEAQRMATTIWTEEVRQTKTDSGAAFVWTRGVVAEGGGQAILEPTTYSRYVFADAVDFHFEQFDRWSDYRNLETMARTFSEYVIDLEGSTEGNDWFSADIGGGVERSGIPSDPKWSRMDVYEYSSSPYALIMAWDESNRMSDISLRVLDRVGSVESPSSVHVTAGFLLLEMVRASAGAS